MQAKAQYQHDVDDFSWMEARLRRIPASKYQSCGTEKAPKAILSENLTVDDSDGKCWKMSFHFIC